MHKNNILLVLTATILSLSSVAMPNNLVSAKTTQKAKQSTKYVKAKIKLPSGYTKSALLKAYQGKPSAVFIKACIKGMNQNNFSQIQTAENKSDKSTYVIPNKLTSKQSSELTNYTLNLINQARSNLHLQKWIYSNGTQQLAIDIATEYSQHNRSIKDGDHYVAGIVQACQKNGLNLNDNYVEDMAGFSSTKSKLSINALKKDIYFGIKQMIFGYVGSSESGRNNKKNYREWEHAGDLFNLQNSKHDGDTNYFGFSISKTGKVYSMHYISVPKFIVSNPEYNLTFKP